MTQENKKLKELLFKGYEDFATPKLSSGFQITDLDIDHINSQ